MPTVLCCGDAEDDARPFPAYLSNFVNTQLPETRPQYTALVWDSRMLDCSEAIMATELRNSSQIV